MNVPARRTDDESADDEILSAGRSILEQEQSAVLGLARRLDHRFCAAVRLLLRCPGSVMVSGMGKAGLVGQKIAATLSSTGTRSHFLHPAEAVHGDLGRIHRDDVMLVLSYSGETEEVLRLLGPLETLRVPVIAMTGRPLSRLARRATVVLELGDVEEAGTLRLAPSASTTAMLALGDALALVASQHRGFTPADFARYHPGGSLGRKLARVEEVMRPLSECRVGAPTRTVRETVVAVSRPGRRTGAVLLTETDGRLAGIFTDSDLARLLERQQDSLLDEPIAHVMTRSPKTITSGQLVTAAIELMVQHKISELPVIDECQHPLGLIDVTDVVGFLPEPTRENRGHGEDQATLTNRAISTSTAAENLRVFPPTE
jgi:arabinose-5-phosphate isomerase